MKIDNFKVEDWFNKYERLAEYDMADTCVESLSLNTLLDITGEKDNYFNLIMDKSLNYGDIQGSERLHKAIRSMYNGISDFGLTVTHGAIGANSLVFNSLVNSGDKVIVYLPIYQQHYSIPKSLGADVKILFLKEENNWLPDIDELKKVIDNKVKLICLNNPNNPTGSVIPLNIMKEIVSVAQKYGTYILCDEVYRGLEHNGNISKSIVELYEKGISTGSMSKVFSLAGLRLGWIIAPKEVMDNIIIHREYNTISVSILDDYFSTLALENKSKIIKRNTDIILKGKKTVSQWIEAEPHISWIEPSGGTVGLLKYDLKMESADLCRKLLSDTGVLFLPASAFDMEGFLRIGYCSDLTKLNTGLQLFSQWLKKF